VNESFQNQVKRAVDRVGGPTKAAHLLRTSNATIHSWIVNQRVPNIDFAKILAAASGIDVKWLRRVR
jgi:DNA-binding transcriptional regulator YdaS (Cro superfamily)